MIPDDYTRGPSHGKIVCQNTSCSNYGIIIGRVWRSCCPKCGEPGTYAGILKNESRLDICDCKICYRRRHS